MAEKGKADKGFRNYLEAHEEFKEKNKRAGQLTAPLRFVYCCSQTYRRMLVRLITVVRVRPFGRYVIL